MLPALELRPGVVVRHQGRACVVIWWNILRNDRRQFIQMKLRDVETGRVTELKENSDSKFEVLEKDEKELSYSYRDGVDEVFFDADGDEVRCPIEAAEEALKWPAEIYTGLYVDGKLVSITPPRWSVLTVAETTPPVRGAGTGHKEAVLENGVKIKVNQLVDVGDRVRVDTETLEFRERVTG